MRTALQRQITATVWQAVGFFGALMLVLLAAFFWGSGIEDEVGTVEDRRQKDHKVLRQLVAEGRPVQAGSASQASPENSGSEGGEVQRSGGSDTAPAPGEALDSEPNTPPKQAGPRHDSPPAPPDSGSGGEAAPAGQTQPQAETPTESTPVDNGSPEEPTTPGPTRSESVLESTGNTVGEVLQGTGDVVEAATCGLTAPLLCPKR
jgi:hypothetical protein